MTRKKTRYKSAPLNALAVFLCLSLSTVSLWLFYKDVNFSEPRTDKTQIATVSFKKRIAQRKYNDRVVWERLNQDSPLYSGDTIHTSEMAEAMIGFKSGVELEIFENSMLQIFVDKQNNARLSMSGGNIALDSSNSTENFKIDLGGTVLDIKAGSKVSATFDNTQNNSSVKVQEGNAVIYSKDNEKEAIITTNESVNISSVGEVKKNLTTVVSIPEILQVFDLSPVLVEWTPLEDSSQKVIVETSAKQDFSVIKDYQEVAGRNSAEVQPVEGSLYWRMHLDGEENILSRGKINYEALEKIVLKSPKNNEIFKNEQKTDVIYFSWNSVKNAQKYKIEISLSEDFSTLLKTQETQSENIILTNLNEGKFYWKITPCYANKIGYSNPSDVRKFFVTGEALTEETAKTEITAEIEEKEEKKEEEKPEENVIEEKIEIPAEKPIENPKPVEKPAEKIAAPKTKPTPKPQPMPKPAEKPKPAPKPQEKPKPVEKPKPQPKPVEKVEIPAEKPAAPPKKTTETPDTSKNKTAAKVAKTPEPAAPNHPEKLNSPVLKTPKENQTIGTEYLSKNRSIYFEWNPVQDATEYDFCIFQKSGKTIKEIFSKKGIKNANITLDDLAIFDIANFEWQVTALYKNGNYKIQSETVSGNFEINFGLPGEVKKIKPGENYGE